jgi:hypothetical protein
MTPLNVQQHAELALNGGERHPGRFAFFIAWAATHRHPRHAIWATTALFGGAGCSLLNVHDAPGAVFAYLFGYVVALVVMVPWFLADYRINGGWRR